MRFSRFILEVFVAVVCAEGTAEAQNYPWCGYYNFGQQGGGATNCGFATFQQCLAAVRGVGGNCGANPMYQPAPGLYYICRLSTRGAILIKRGGLRKTSGSLAKSNCAVALPNATSELCRSPDRSVLHYAQQSGDGNLRLLRAPIIMHLQRNHGNSKS
jgi:hypothetical protein